MAPFNNGCKPVDLSRTCFSAKKTVTVDGVSADHPGVYFFTERRDFVQRSGLGGHWWEGRPFQTGERATAPFPTPTWRNGSMPEFPGEPPICLCGVIETEFTPSRVQLLATRISDGHVYDLDATGIVVTAGQVHAEWSRTGAGVWFQGAYHWFTCTWEGAVSNFYPCYGLHATSITQIEELSDPDYVFTVGPFNLTLPAGGTCEACSVKLRWFR